MTQRLDPVRGGVRFVGRVPHLASCVLRPGCTVLLALSLAGCSTWSRAWGPTPCCIQGKPAVRRQPIAWHLFDVTVLEPIEQPLHLIRSLRKLFGVPLRSANLRDGAVPDTTFFTNRDPASLTPEQVRLGPTRPEDAARPPFLVTKPKTEGKTFGFFATDARGQRYLLKFDPAGAPELLSGAEVVSSKLLYALGYHVPSYEVVFLAPDQLRLTEGLLVKDRRGRLAPFGEPELAALLEGQLRDGTLRVSASKILEGTVLGPAPFKRFRDCAEIRALKLAYAWINNIDTKDHNSLLVWDGARTVGYLIDFGTSLGADAGLGGPKSPCAGWRNVVDLKEASLELVTLGLHRPACDVAEAPLSPSVGLFSPRVDPDRWKPYAPNVAFAQMTEDDARWMARRMARLSRQQLEAAVAAGQYRDPADAASLVETLEQRRQRIVQRYVTPDPAQERPRP
jgi:hypothetical protein